MGTREADWDSSFNQILNRTKQNLNRINQRYAPTPELTSSYNLPIVPTISNNESRYSRGNVYESSNQNSLNSSQGAAKGNVKAPTNADQDSLIYALIERVSKLELSEQANASTAQRLTAIEKTLGDINSSISASFHDMKEMQRNILSLQNKSAVTSGIIEVIQHDNDSKRSVISKMDSWIRQGEIWREDVDEKINTLRKLTAQQDRQRQEQRDQITDTASKYDLDQLRDKVSIQTQQTISAQLSAWYEKVEYNLRNLEKQVALVRINATPKEGMLVTPEEVHAALNTSMPSEMLVKGVVSSQILDLEGKLEEKLEARLSSFLKNEAIRSHNDLQKVIRDKINLLCAENGIVGTAGAGLNQEDPFSEEGGISDTQLLEEAQVSERYRKRIVNAKLEAEKELFSLSTQISDVRGALASLQNTINVDQNSSKAALLNMERKVEEAIVIANNSVQSINSRCSRIEDRQRESEVKQSDLNKVTKEELIAKINDLSKDWLLERVTLDRRLLINENIAADCLERIKLSTTVLDNYFQNSRDIITFRQTTEDFGKLQLSFNNLVNEVRDTSNTVVKLSANNVSKSDYVSMMERITAMEPVVHDTIPEYVESTKKLVDYSLVMQAKVSNIENINAHNNNELQTISTRLNNLTTTAYTASNLATVATEELKLVSGRLQQLDSAYHADVTSLKDLTGAMSSRIMAVESKLTLASKTAQSENVIKNNQLMAMSTQISDIHSSHNDLQATLNKIQNAAETHRNEVNTKLSLIDIRLHQAQQHSGGGAYTAAAPAPTPNTSFASQSGTNAGASSSYTAPAARLEPPVTSSAAAAPAPVVTAKTTAGYVMEKNKWNNTSSGAGLNSSTASSSSVAAAAAPVNVSSSFAESEVVHNSFDDVTNASFAASAPTAPAPKPHATISASAAAGGSSGAFLTDHSVTMNDHTAVDDHEDDEDDQDHDDRSSVAEGHEDNNDGVDELEDSYMSTTNLDTAAAAEDDDDVSPSLMQESYLNATGNRDIDQENEDQQKEDSDDNDHSEEEHSIEDPDDYNSASEESQHHSDDDDKDDEEEGEQLSVHDGEPSSPPPRVNQSVSLEALAAMANQNQKTGAPNAAAAAASGQQRQSQLDHSMLENSFDESSSMLDIPDLDKSGTYAPSHTTGVAATTAGGATKSSAAAAPSVVTAAQRPNLEDSFASSDLEELPSKSTDPKTNRTVGEISMIPMSNNNSFDDSTMQLDNSLLQGLSAKPSAMSVTSAGSTATAPTAATGAAGGGKNSSLLLNSFDDSTVQSTPAKAGAAAGVPPLDLKPAVSQKLHNDWDDSDAELSPHKPTATKPSGGGSSGINANNVSLASDSSFATCASPSPGSNAFPATTTAAAAAPAAAVSASSYVPVVAAPTVAAASNVSDPAPATAAAAKSSGPTPGSSQASSQAPTPTLSEGVSAVTATLSIKERLKLRQEMLKQQKQDAAAGIDRASPVPPATTAAAPPTVTAPAPVPVTTTAPTGVAAPTPIAAATTATATAAVPAAGSSLSPRKPPVIPTLSLPTKGDPVITESTAASAAPVVNRRKSIDDILANKQSQLDFSFDSDSEEEPKASSNSNSSSTTGKYSAPAAAANVSKGGYTSSTAAKATASKSYDDEVLEFDADEFD